MSCETSYSLYLSNFHFDWAQGKQFLARVLLRWDFVSEGRTPGDSGCRWSHRRDAKYDHVETVEFFFFFFAETQRLELLA